MTYFDGQPSSGAGPIVKKTDIHRGVERTVATSDHCTCSLNSFFPFLFTACRSKQQYEYE
eukprot:scaffold480788_cov18-Prasinocladus_malaysianus.AAC.1